MRVEETRSESARGQSDILIHDPCFCRECPAAAAGISVPELRERIVRHCSPTLAGLKCGSMFKVCTGDPHGFSKIVDDVLGEVHHRGVRIVPLHEDGCGVLLYVYRPKLLEQRIRGPGVATFLSGYGYDGMDSDSLLERLMERFSECGMPPEVGVFLDYPLEDVVGYIENKGIGCRTIGCWKVYGDVEQAERRFVQFKRCRDVFVRRLSEGICLERLAVRG